MPADLIPVQLGYFGKYPGYRDFVQRGLPVSFTELWRDWLARVMDEGRSRHGEDWLDVYRHSPVWRYALRDGRVGDGVWLGGMMPSADARGRYFPLVLAVSLPAEPLVHLMSRALPFLTALEDAMIATLEAPYPGTDELATHFDALGASTDSDCLRQPRTAPDDADWHQRALWALDDFVAADEKAISVWHAAQVASGGERLSVYASLPDPAAFVELQMSTVPEEVEEDDIGDDAEAPPQEHDDQAEDAATDTEARQP